MTDLQAALGIAQFEKFDEMQDKREQLVNRYNQALGKYSDSLRIQYDTEEVYHAWHLYPIVLKDLDRHNRVDTITTLNDRGIGTSVHFYSPPSPALLSKNIQFKNVAIIQLRKKCMMGKSPSPSFRA